MNLFGRKNNEDNNEQEEKQVRRGPSPFMWLIVGAYLLYIDYNLLIKDGLFANGVNSSNWHLLVFAILFAAVAVWLFIRSFRQLKEEKAKNDQDYDEMIAEEEEERKLREMYSKEDLEAFEAEQAKLTEEASSEDDTQE